MILATRKLNTELYLSILPKIYSAVPGDVRKPQDMENAVKVTIEKFGRIDFLINGAAGNFLAPLQGLSYNAFKTVIEIDVLGTFNLTKAASEYLKKSNGSIINVSATLYYTGVPFQVKY
jgi:peroxisomal 2,4-dienoyl-CoA reductase